MSNVVQQCKKLGVAIGDTIQGREEYCDGWSEARLTLLWIGAETAVWEVAIRDNRQPEWQSKGEGSNWSLSCRDWRKVHPNAQSKPPAESGSAFERLEAQIEAIKRAERYGVEMRLKDVLDLADLRLRINLALSILQTGDLPDGAEK